MAESNIQMESYVVIENVPLTVAMKDLKAHFLKKSNGGDGSEFSIDVLLRFEDDAVADAVLAKSHEIGGKKVLLHPYSKPSSCVQEYIQDDFKNVLIVRGIDVLDDRDLQLHFMSVDNGGNGRPIKVQRTAKDSAIMIFSDSEVASDLLGRAHEVTVDGNNHLVKLYRPHEKALLVVRGTVESPLCLDPWIIRSFKNDFAVEITQRGDVAYISGSLSEISAVQKSMKLKLPGFDTDVKEGGLTHKDESEENKEFERTVVVRGIEGLSDEVIQLHFALSDNGGDGKMPEYERLDQDVAELKFEDPKVARRFLKSAHKIKSRGDERSVKVERPAGEILDNVSARLSRAFVEDIRVRPVIERKFNVKLTTTNDDLFISGAFKEVTRVYEFLRNREFDLEFNPAEDLLNDAKNRLVVDDVRPVADIELNDLHPALVFYMLRTYGDHDAMRGLKLQWGTENRNIKVMVSEAHRADLLRIYDRTKVRVKKATLDVGGIPQDDVSRVVEQLNSQMRDLSILKQGTKLLIVGSQEALDEDLGNVKDVLNLD